LISGYSGIEKGPETFKVVVTELEHA
jgi:hypothetical protein